VRDAQAHSRDATRRASSKIHALFFQERRATRGVAASGSSYSDFPRHLFSTFSSKSSDKNNKSRAWSLSVVLSLQKGVGMLKSKWARAAVLGAMACVVPVLAAKTNVVHHHIVTKPLTAVHHNAVKTTVVKTKRVTKLTTAKAVHKLHTTKVVHHSLSSVHAKHHALVKRSISTMK
jgi:hypothetical protein